MSFMARQDLMRAEQNLAVLKKAYFNRESGDWSDSTAGLVINTLDRLERVLKEILNQQEAQIPNPKIPDPQKTE